MERPASVVKELVENAIDAGAAKIAITVTQGGRKLVAVQDDGCGMSKDDAVLSLERQATSKIRDVSDIEEIDTLGFRGEAIPSIASVSRFSITTRRADSDEGTFIQVNAGTLAEVRAAGCPPGTRVEVHDLFCNVPARRKFLRAYATEEAHVKSVFTIHALAHPQIAFSLNVDGRDLYRLAPAADVKDRIRDIFGEDFLETMLPLAGNETANRANVRVTGFIERPNLSTPTRRDQYVFVNGRPATAASIAYALREAYPRRPGDTRPAAVMFIDLPPQMVDVNVHPTKREVRFRDNVAVREAITAAIEMALAAPTTVAAVTPPPEALRTTNYRRRTTGGRSCARPGSARNRIRRRSGFTARQALAVVSLSGAVGFGIPADRDGLRHRHHQSARGARTHRIREASLRFAEDGVAGASHTRDDENESGRGRKNLRVAGRDTRDGLSDRAIRRRHLQDRRRAAGTRHPFAFCRAHDDGARPRRIRLPPRRSALARRADPLVRRLFGVAPTTVPIRTPRNETPSMPPMPAVMRP